MSRWVSILLCLVMFSFAQRTEAETYKVKANTAQRDQVRQVVLATFGTKGMVKDNFEKKVAELWSRTVTLTLSSTQRAAMAKDTNASVASTALRMDSILDVAKFMNSVTVTKDGLYQVQYTHEFTWKEYLEQVPCINITYTPVK